jgi:hypothetical protein
VGDREFCGFRLRHKFGRHSRFQWTLPELKSVLKQFGRLLLQDLARHQLSGLAIGSRPNPLH